MSSVVNELVKKYPPISEQVSADELTTILNWLEQSLLNNPRGSIVEFGCYIGTTSLMISRYLDKTNLTNIFHVYDSFEGLPKKNTKDQSPIGIDFVEGELRAQKKDFLKNYKKSALKNPIIHKGWFKDIGPKEVPNEIAFAFLDGDYYDSIKDSLNKIEGKLAKGSVIIIDDYQSESLPGAKKATDEWLSKQNNHKLIKIENSLAIICDGRANY
jgi:O-methyltransferase